MSFLLVFRSFVFSSKCLILYTWWFLNSDRQNDGKISPLDRQSFEDSERLWASHWGKHMTSVLIVICNAQDMTTKFRTHQVCCYYFSIMMTSSSFSMYKEHNIKTSCLAIHLNFDITLPFICFAALHLVCKNCGVSHGMFTSWGPIWGCPIKWIQHTCTFKPAVMPPCCWGLPWASQQCQRHWYCGSKQH